MSPHKIVQVWPYSQVSVLSDNSAALSVWHPMCLYLGGGTLKGLSSNGQARGPTLTAPPPPQLPLLGWQQQVPCKAGGPDAPSENR